MLQIPTSKLLTFRFFFFCVLALSSIISVLTATTFFIPDEIETLEDVPKTGRYREFSDFLTSNTVTETIDRFPDGISILIITICLTIIIISLFTWTPSLSNVIRTEKPGRMVWKLTKLGIPERVYCLKDGKINLKIRRNHSSFNGLLMRIFNLEIHFSEESPEIRRISDFTSMKRKKDSKNRPILSKTVKLKNLPLQVIQVQAILKTIP